VIPVRAAGWSIPVGNARFRCVVGLALLTAAGLSSGAADSASSGASLIASPESGWPQFRGPRRDGVSDEKGLLASWPGSGPPLTWSATGAGRGFSSPIISGGRIFLTGDFGEDSYVLAYDLTGKQLWRAKNGAAWLNQYQGARASVTFSAGNLFHQNAHGRVACFAAETGKERWSLNVLERFGGENITWGLSECLLVDERAVYVTVAGRDTLVVALDKSTGEVLWQTKGVPGSSASEQKENAGYAPPIMVRFDGRRLMIGCSSRHLFCLDLDTREIQWTRPRPTSYSVLAMSPVLVGDAVFMTAPFGPPGALHQLKAPAQKGGTVDVEDVWSTNLDTAQGGVVHARGRLFGSYYPRRGGWASIDTTNGKVLHVAADLLKGAGLFADERLYVLSEDGWMLLLNPTDKEFESKGRFRLTTARDRDAWAHPVIHDGRLYLRYHDTFYCYDVRVEP
jgi:outer membrane protein assembly factor BamB